MTLEKIRHNVEKRFGLPDLEKLAGVSEKIPDKETLSLYLELLKALPDKEMMRELNKFIQSAGKISTTAPDIDKIIVLFTLAREINFKELDGVIVHLSTLVKELPTGGLETVNELVDQLKKE